MPFGMIPDNQSIKGPQKSKSTMKSGTDTHLITSKRHLVSDNPGSEELSMWIKVHQRMKRRNLQRPWDTA
jgi:hypothetical protein